MKQSFLCIGVFIVGCQSSPAKPTFQPQRLEEQPGLHNLFQITEQFYSGSSPEGEAGFRSLSELGVRTIISVDGAKPQLELARQFGLRYVHLPIGYDGVPTEQAQRIAKMLRDLPGKFYLHCHHGKHRGPAAAIAAMRCLEDRCSAQKAMEFLQQAGTDPRYQGLFSSVQQQTMVTNQQLDSLPSYFPEIATVPDLVHRMVLIDEHWDHLKILRKTRWKNAVSHPDLDPAHEALQLLEQYRETNRLPEMQHRPVEFRELMHKAEQAADQLEQTLRQSATVEEIDKAFQANESLCKQCHELFRDQPKK